MLEQINQGGLRMFTGKCGKPLRRGGQSPLFMRSILVGSARTVWDETKKGSFACCVINLAERAGAV